MGLQQQSQYVISHSPHHSIFLIHASVTFCMHACVCAGCIGPLAYFTSAITVKIYGNILENYAKVEANLILMHTDPI